jgi:hypothetical protein
LLERAHALPPGTPSAGALASGLSVLYTCVILAMVCLPVVSAHAVTFLYHQLRFRRLLPSAACWALACASCMRKPRTSIIKRRL